jgi:hypothetical protein
MYNQAKKGMLLRSSLFLTPPRIATSPNSNATAQFPGAARTKSDKNNTKKDEKKQKRTRRNDDERPGSLYL